MGRKRKARRRSLRPPLSLLDKCIYWAGFLLSFVFAGALYIFISRLWDIIAFHDPSVIAYRSHGTHLFTLPFLLYLGLSPFFFILFSLESRKPIFGSRKIRYGETPWEKGCFPLFDPRRKRVHTLPSQKALRRRIALLWLIALLFTSLIAFFGLFGRVCLTQEHHIISYNAINQESSVSYTPEDYSHLTLQTKYVSGYRSASYWKYELTIEMTDGRSFSFSDRDFDRRVPNHTDTCLKHMAAIKALFPPSRITILGREDIEKVADDRRLNDEQRLLLQNLFIG